MMNFGTFLCKELRFLAAGLPASSIHQYYSRYSVLVLVWACLPHCQLCLWMAQFFWSIILVQKCFNMLKLAKLVQTCSNLFKLVQTCSNLFKIVQTCSNLFKLVKPCSNLFKIVQIFSNMFKIVEIFSNIFKLVQTCSKLFKLVQTSSNFF